MAIMSDPVSPTTAQPDVDRRPGSSNVEWAERAYRLHQKARTMRQWRARAVQALHSLRLYLVALVVALVAIGLAVGLTYQGSSPPAAAHPAASPHTVTPPPVATARPPLTLPPGFRPFTSLFPAPGTPLR